jgi:hypothetical protein
MVFGKIYIAKREVEGKMVKPRYSRAQKGQSTTLFAVFLPAIIVLLIGVLDTLATTSRLMDGVSVTNLAAMAGAQEVKVLPNGVIQTTDQAYSTATWYFVQQAPSYVQLMSVWCGQTNNRPSCIIKARVETAGLMLGGQYINITAVGYLSYGCTRGDQ